MAVKKTRPRDTMIFLPDDKMASAENILLTMNSDFN
jgi:hypothetical protein